MPAAKSPKGKLPYLIHDGQRIADSELITEYLEGITDGKVYAGLTSAQKASGLALARLAEDHLYWLLVASRWLDDKWWPNVVQGFLFGEQPNIFDFSIARILAGMYDNEPVTWLTETASHYEGPRDYAERVQEAVGIWGLK